MATLTVQAVDLDGLKPSYGVCASGGDEFVNSGKDFIHVKNGDASPHTVTVDSQQACNQGFDHDAAVAIPAGEERMIGPFSKDRFNDSEEKVQISYDAVTSMTIAAIRVS